MTVHVTIRAGHDIREILEGPCSCGDHTTPEARTPVAPYVPTVRQDDEEPLSLLDAMKRDGTL